MRPNSSAAKATRPGTVKGVSVARRHTSPWTCGLAFFFGFCIEFDMLLGIGGEVASANGLYGFRLLDFACFGAVALLGFYSLAPSRILSLALYGLIVGILFSATALSSDQQTMILAYRYMLYSIAALYVVVLINEAAALEWFCWGLIIGLLATIPIFAMQASAYASKLIDWGLIPPYAQAAFMGAGGDFIRYAGLTGHPNEAGHVAALSAAAGAYFAFVRRKFLPTLIVAAGLMAVFYYARSRAGLFAGGSVLALSFVAAQARFTFFRFTVTLAAVIITVVLASQLDFVASRFSDDAAESINITERVTSTLAGLQILLAHPLGLPINTFSSYVLSQTVSVSTPHNGFIFFGGIFGVLPLAMLLVVCVANLRVRDDKDVFFAFLALQVSVSLLFEQLPVSCSYQLAICIMMAHTYIRTGIGSALVFGSPDRSFRGTFEPLRRGAR